MDDPIIVLEKDGISYIHFRSKHFENQYLVNGKPPVKCPGNAEYAMIEGKVEKIEKIIYPVRNVIKFRLKEQYEAITNLPKELPKETFKRDEYGDWYGENIEFYEPVYDDPPPKYEPIDFLVIDRNCEPVKMPHYVKVDFPYNLRHYPEVHHKYPCYIDRKDVYNLVKDRIIKVVDNSSGKYTRTNYSNIQTMTIYEVIEIPFRCERKEVIPARTKRGKDKYKTVIEKTKKVKLFEIVGDYRTNDEDVIRIESIRGNNYEELMKNLEEYIQSFLSIFDKTKRIVCPHCKGEGILEIQTDN